MQVFRENIFSMADRKQIPTRIYQILENELQAEQAQEETALNEEGDIFNVGAPLASSES